MTIYINDRTETRAPMPMDAKMYVGAGAEYEYNTKEDIPSAYRYRGMVIYEVPASLVADIPYPIYQLQGGIADVNWVQIGTGSPSGGGGGVARIYTDKNTATQGQTTFNLPAGFTIGITSIYINGILIVNDNGTTNQYNIVDNVTYTSVVFSFGLELNDTVLAVQHLNI